MLDRTAKMQPDRTSLQLDYDNGRLLEIQAIFGSLLQMARSHGAELAKIEILCQQLEFLDRKQRFKSVLGDR